MARLLCSTGALIGRPNGRNHRLLPGLAEKLSCDGLEMMFYDSWYGQEEEVIQSLKNTPLPTPVFHAEKNICLSLSSDREAEKGLQLFETNCRTAKALQAEKMVFHLWDGRMDIPAMERAMAHVPKLMEISAAHGILFTVENIVSMYTDPLSCLRLLHERYPSLPFTYDTKMASFHGQESSLYENGNMHLLPCIRHFHINDYRGNPMDWQCFRTLHPGEGQVDFPRLFALAKQINYTGDYTVEATSFEKTGFVDCDKLNRTLMHIRQMMNETGD
ncbi:MAG: sugar phosphate isomerase/epimerase [Clostridia bacterium]|nr:sugar phosphate isomerase/epimerase [Clostridia bacterium]